MPVWTADGAAGRRAIAAALLFGGSALALGCGARSGLASPERPLDAAPDGGLDGASAPALVPLCVEAPREAGPVRATLTLPINLAVVDLFFLIDATASMRDEIDNVRAGLRTRVVPGVREAIPDAAFGLAFAGEFPVLPHASGDILPYELRSPITSDVIRIEAALDGAPVWGNVDVPEAQIEGLYQLATGDGLPPWIPASAGCPSGGSGGACFRDEALPLVVLVTDAPMHNGPPGVAPEEAYAFAGPHDYAETLAALRALGALVIGLGARDPGSDSPMPHLRALAEDTGAIDAEGAPLVFDIGSRGTEVGSGVVQAIRRLAEGLPLDVDALVLDVPGDAWDALELIHSIRVVAAEPPEGAAAIRGGEALGVRPGTRLVYEIEVDTRSMPASDSTRRIPVRIIFRAFERTWLGAVDLQIVVPGLEGGGCLES
ncbi:MAG: hypothetical protein OEY14_05305 [Myxococcales bacterium]|nr:hypothetical protein [Myxococcales bacterium]